MVVSGGPSSGTRQVQGCKGGRNPGGRVHPPGGAKVVPAALEAERALESLELAERRSALTLRGAQDVPGRLGQRGVAGVRLRAEAAHQLTVLRLVETRGLPEEGRAPLVRDLLGEPLER